MASRANDLAARLGFLGEAAELSRGRSDDEPVDAASALVSSEYLKLKRGQRVRTLDKLRRGRKLEVALLFQIAAEIRK